MATLTYHPRPPWHDDRGADGPSARPDQPHHDGRPNPPPPWHDDEVTDGLSSPADQPAHRTWPHRAPPWHPDTAEDTHTAEDSHTGDRAGTTSSSDGYDKPFPPPSGGGRLLGPGPPPNPPTRHVGLDVESSPRARPARARRQRLVAAAVMLVLVPAGGAAFLFGRARWQGQQALAVEHHIPHGIVVSAADLTPVFVALHGGEAGALVPADQKSAVVGRITATELPAGALLRASDVLMPAP